MRKGNENNKRRKLLPAFLAVAMAAVMLVPMGNSTAKAAEGDGPYTLTVNVAEESFLKEDPDLGKATVKIFKLADLNEQDGVESWDLAAPFATADTDGSLEALLDKVSHSTAATAEEKKVLLDQYQRMTRLATSLLVDKKIDSTADTTFGAAKGIGEKGIYIAVPVMGNEIKIDGAGNAMLSTDKWKYTFIPMLVFVPSKEAASVDEWAYGFGDCTDVVINAKESRQSITTPSKPTKVIEKTVKTTRIVKTGDEFPVLPILVAVVAAALLVLIRRKGAVEK